MNPERLKPLVRPLLSIMGYGVLSIFAIAEVFENTSALPDWYLPVFIAGTMVHFLGWDLAREYWKRKGEDSV